jgi:hypothetical protein
MLNFQLLMVSKLLSGTGTKYRIVRETGTDNQVIVASAATQALCGVVGSLDITAGTVGDVCVSGITPVEYGGEVAAGDPLTSDAVGRAIKAIEGQNVIGVAQEAGALNTIGSLLVIPQVKLANSGVAALVAAGLGAGVAVDHADSSPVTLLAANATHDRAVLVIATCTQSLAGSDAPTFDIGWTADPDGLIDQTLLAGATAGETFIGAGVVPATNLIIATLATGGTTTNDAGAFNVVVLALPTTA